MSLGMAPVATRTMRRRTTTPTLPQLLPHRQVAASLRKEDDELGDGPGGDEDDEEEDDDADPSPAVAPPSGGSKPKKGGGDGDEGDGGGEKKKTASGPRNTATYAVLNPTLGCPEWANYHGATSELMLKSHRDAGEPIKGDPLNGWRPTRQIYESEACEELGTLCCPRAILFSAVKICDAGESDDYKGCCQMHLGAMQKERTKWKFLNWKAVEKNLKKVAKQYEPDDPSLVRVVARVGAEDELVGHIIFEAQGDHSKEPFDIMKITIVNGATGEVDKEPSFLMKNTLKKSPNRLKAAFEIVKGKTPDSKHLTHEMFTRPYDQTEFPDEVSQSPTYWVMTRGPKGDEKLRYSGIDPFDERAGNREYFPGTLDSDGHGETAVWVYPVMCDWVPQKRSDDFYKLDPEFYGDEQAYYWMDMCTKPTVDFHAGNEQANCAHLAPPEPQDPSLPECFSEGLAWDAPCRSIFEVLGETPEQCVEFSQTTRAQGGPSGLVGKYRMELNSGQDPVLTSLFHLVVYWDRKPTPP